MESSLKSSPLWRIGAAAFVVGSMVTTYFLSGPRNRRSRNEIVEEAQKEVARNLTTPSNATFGVAWSTIYAGTAALAIHQALPSQRHNARYEKALPWLVACYGLNAAFGYFFSSNKQSGRVGAALITIVTLPPALAVHQQLKIGQVEVVEPENTLRKSISLYAGWVTVASVISAGNLLIQSGYQPAPAIAARWMYAMLPIAGALGWVVSRRLNDPYYQVPFVAAFSGIAAKQYSQQNGIAALSGALALALAVDVEERVRKQKAPTIPLADPKAIPSEVIAEDNPREEAIASADQPGTTPLTPSAG